MAEQHEAGFSRITSDTLVAGGIAAAALVVEHYALPQRKPPLTYVIGVATLLVPFTVVCHRAGHNDLAAAAWLIAGIGGAADVGTYLFDWLKVS